MTLLNFTEQGLKVALALKQGLDKKTEKDCVSVYVSRAAYARSNENRVNTTLCSARSSNLYHVENLQTIFPRCI